MIMKILKTEIQPQKIIFKDSTLFLVTTKNIHIVNFEGKIFPDIPLHNAKIKINCNKNKKCTKYERFNIILKDIFVFRTNIFVQDTSNDLYLTEVGKQTFFKHNIKASKVVCDKKLYLVSKNTVYEMESKSLEKNPKAIIRFSKPITDCLSIGQILFFFVENKAYLCKKNMLKDECKRIGCHVKYNIDNKSTILKYKTTIIEISALSSMQFIHSMSNGRFVLLTSEHSIIVFSYHTNIVVLKKPELFYNVILIDIYVFVFAYKIAIYHAIDGALVQKHAITILMASYDSISHHIVAYNGVLFYTNILQMLKTNSKPVRGVKHHAFQNTAKSSCNTKNTTQNLLVARSAEQISDLQTNQLCFEKKHLTTKNSSNTVQHSQINNNSITNKTNNTVDLSKIQYKHIIKNNSDLLQKLLKSKLFEQACTMHPTKTYLEYSKFAYNADKIEQSLYFYAQTYEKYKFDRHFVIGFCRPENKKSLQTQKIKFYCTMATDMYISVRNLMYFLFVKSIVMKKEMDYLFYLCCRLRMVNYQKLLLQFAINRKMKIKFLKRISEKKLITDDIQKYKQHIVTEVLDINNVKMDTQNDHIEHTMASQVSKKHGSIQNEITSSLQDKTSFSCINELSPLTKLILQYWKINNPEKVIMYFFLSKRYKKCMEVLFKTHTWIPNLQNLLLSIMLFTKIRNTKLLKLYNNIFPNMLSMITKANESKNLYLYFKHVLSPLENTQYILKNMQEMGIDECNMVIDTIYKIDTNEHMDYFGKTLEFIANIKKESEKKAFRCCGKIVEM